MSNTKSQLVYKTEKSSPIQKYPHIHGLKLLYVLWKVRMQNEKCTLNKFIMVKHCKASSEQAVIQIFLFISIFFIIEKLWNQRNKIMVFH